MPTSPFGTALVTRLAGPTAWRFESELGAVFTPRFMCCTDPNAMDLEDGKEPVAVIELSPNPAFVGQTVSYDGTDSYDPDGTVVTWAWTFEGHTPASGTAISGTLNYGNAGTYTIQLTVTDGTSLKSSPAREELVVRAPEGEYFAATSSGVYYTGDGGGTWSQVLSGEANCVVVDPATNSLPLTQRTVWAALEGSIAVTNVGTSAWVAKTPGTVTNAWADAVPPVPGSLDYKQLHFAGNRLWLTGNWTSQTGDRRGWLFYTEDHPDMRSSTAGSVEWEEVTY